MDLHIVLELFFLGLQGDIFRYAEIVPLQRLYLPGQLREGELIRAHHRGGRRSLRLLIFLDQFLQGVLDFLRHVDHVLRPIAPIRQVSVPQPAREETAVVRRKLGKRVKPFLPRLRR